MTKHFTSEEKNGILLSALAERYNSIHIIRERVQNTCIWTLGILLAVSGWFVQTDKTFTCLEKQLFVLAVLISFYAIRFRYLRDLEIGFRNQQLVLVRLEKTVGLYTPKVFDDEETCLYPEGWMKAGQNKCEGKFFGSTHLLLYIGVCALILSIVLKGYLF